MLYLASTSPRRRELLGQIGAQFEVLKVSVDETPLMDEQPYDYVQRLAVAKAQAGVALVATQDLVLAADTTVVCEGQIIGKPATLTEALTIWRQLSGRSHHVLTGLAMARDRLVLERVVTTEVWFKPLTEAEMLSYWQTGEPQDKAGGYGIQGKGALWVEKIHGSYTNVVGLPLMETGLLLNQLGYPV